MATSSLLHNVVLSSENQVENFVKAIEKSKETCNNLTKSKQHKKQVKKQSKSFVEILEEVKNAERKRC